MGSVASVPVGTRDSAWRRVARLTLQTYLKGLYVGNKPRARGHCSMRSFCLSGGFSVPTYQESRTVLQAGTWATLPQLPPVGRDQ